MILKEKGLTVLGLFDGKSCGQLGLESAGIKVYKYYASEIHEPSIKVAQHNFPNTVQIGDISNICFSKGYLYIFKNKEERESFQDGKSIIPLKLYNIGIIDLLIGGSPCQSLSITMANKFKEGTRGLKGKSKLFYEYIRILEEVKPRYFMLENVESMKDSDKQVITDIIGVDPIMIDSALVSAQERKRYYWTNIEGITQPKDKGLLLKDIVQPLHEIPDNLIYKDVPFTYHGDDKRPCATLHIFNYESLQRVYGLNQKAPTLTQCQGGHTQKKIMQDGIIRRLTPLEYERLQQVPDNYTSCVANGHRYNMLGNGWNIETVAHIFSFMQLENEYISNTVIHNDLMNTYDNLEIAATINT